MVSGVIAEKLLLPARSWPASSLCPPLLKSLCRGPETKRLGSGGGQGWSGGLFLKGIVTVGAEDVHDHSVNRFGVVVVEEKRREESTFPRGHPPPAPYPFSSSLVCGAVRLAGKKNTDGEQS